MISQANRSIVDFWTTGIDYSLDQFEFLGKTIARPALVNACGAHYVRAIRDGYRPMEASLDALRIIHTRDQRVHIILWDLGLDP